MREPFIAESARKHGVNDDTIIHVFKNRIRSETLDERLTMLIGPDHAGNLFEIAVVVLDKVLTVVHAMPARAKYRR